MYIHKWHHPACHWQNLANCLRYDMAFRLTGPLWGESTDHCWNLLRNGQSLSQSPITLYCWDLRKEHAACRLSESKWQVVFRQFYVAAWNTYWAYRIFFNIWILQSYDLVPILGNRKWDMVVLTWTHWGQDKMAAIFQTTFSNGFLWMKMHEFRLKFHWNMFPKVQLTIFRQGFR